MNDSEYIWITFDCEAPGQPQWCELHRATLMIGIGEPCKDYVGDTAYNSKILLRAGEQTYENKMEIYGFELRGFAESLQKLHSSLVGSARLNDWWGKKLLCFTVIDQHRGQIAVGGQLTPAVLDTKFASADRFVSDVYGHFLGIKITFEGLSLDQSYLNRPLSELKRFVDEHATECDFRQWPPSP